MLTGFTPAILVLAANEKDFSFGFEMGRIGRSLAEGRGFSNPFNETTGSTAWEPPFIPFSSRACSGSPEFTAALRPYFS